METDAKTLQEWLENDLAVAIDVREQAEHDAGHIGGAKLIPIGSLSAADVENFSPRKIVFYCGGGGRGGRATTQVKEESPNLQVYNLRGGFRSWKAAGFETAGTNDAAPSFCSLEKK